VFRFHCLRQMVMGKQKLTPIKWQTLVKIAEHLGYKHNRTKGSHMAYVKKGSPRPITIPKYKIEGEQIQRSLMRTAGIDRDEFIRLKEKFE